MKYLRILRLGLNYTNCVIKNFQYPRNTPKNLLILITIPRSGSTWLLDLLRCHPNINYEPTTVVYNSLKLTGGRYPRDLVSSKWHFNELFNSKKTTLNFENSYGNWVRIKNYNIFDKTYLIDDVLKKHSFSIEKIHPEFYNFDTQSFLQNIDNLESKGTQVKFVYLIRDPKAAILSWLNYQKRNPLWNRNRDNNLLVNYYNKNLSKINELISIRKGPIFDYSTLINNPELVLNNIYLYLWPKLAISGKQPMETIIKESIHATSRSEKIKSGSPFLGKDAGPIKGNKKEFESYFDSYKGNLDVCYKNYQSLLNLCH